MHETKTFNQPTPYGGAAFGDRPAQPGQEMMKLLRDYARERPEAAALWCLGIGFILGWKLKPW